ncbi:acyl-CoA dehydrogenase family protein [Burkholderia plantarii]|uniref:Acyl-CoA dehydrogenase n=1 Tax=Burkholderia plantarii TaxID=41899 RepID=A0A0B6S2Z7_BURPL|nr:acyl-CoA dehydrogenase family protein [Burkholderia plantarii]AJK46611.1 acyl-CoA dehydrogenase [Burkholderia plantarii]ALK30734.1 acyl-CoA dehydrogenase domain-containing protein [Burkholderia plantarii]GLZ19352.1 acyl-CoA dehydrogenase [Burkholderia plantarii]
MSSPYPAESYRTFAGEVRERLRACLLPEAEGAEARGHLPRATWRTLAGEGLLDLPLEGEGFVRSAVFLEELGRLGYAGVRAAIGVHAFMAASYLAWFGSEAQRERYLARMRDGTAVAALAITEDQAGSDLSNLQCLAESDGDAWRVNGTKRFISNGSQASLIVALVRSNAQRHALGGCSLLLIDADAPGVTRTPLNLLGWRSADVCDIGFEQVAVPRENVLGKPDKAFTYLMRCLDFERMVAGMLALGGAAHGIRLVDRFVRQRVVRGAPLSANQSVRHELAELIAELRLLRCFGYQLVLQYAGGRLGSGDASILKLRSTELAKRAAHRCAQFHGARGYLSESEVARLYRDATAGTIAAGASELVREIVFDSVDAEALLD